MTKILPALALSLAASVSSLVADLKEPSVTPISDLAAIMPKHGTVSTVPAERWENGLAAGNGVMGAMMYGDLSEEKILVNHCKLWMPRGSLEVFAPDGTKALADLRKAIREKGYGPAEGSFLEDQRQGGWGGKLAWTDFFHPGFTLKLMHEVTEPVTNYAKVENFSTGEVWTQWTTSEGDFSRHLFVSRTDNTIVTRVDGPPGKVGFTLTLGDMGTDLMTPQVTYSNGWILLHNVYAKGKGGYDGAIRVVNDGGTQTSDGKSVSIQDAGSVTLYVRILPWRTPMPESQSWITDPKNPDFADGHHPAKRNSVQMAAKEYDPKWMDEMKSDLSSLGDYAALLKPHSAWWSKIFDRVSIDLGGSAEERAMSSEAILDKAKTEQKLSPALLERMYDAGRYVFMCCAGPQTPPTLFGIWTDGWSPSWSGDYTTDTNLELDTECAYSANMAELMKGYFYLWDSFLPDFHRNAKGLYGCNGIVVGMRHSNNGLSLHWDGGWPGFEWTVGGDWISHWYYDYYAYTGDKKFLRDEAIPFMKQVALFHEDFLKGTEGADGHYTFTPAFSAENGQGDNTSQDIEMTHELLTNLIAGCETLGIEQASVARWKALLAKLPPLLINDQGQLQEWSNHDPNNHEKNNHRHLMHLYGAFESQQFTEESDPKLFAAARVALVNRTTQSTEDATHGHMHMALAAANLGMGDLSFQRLEMLAKHHSMFANMVDDHFSGPNVLCDDGNGATPEIVDRMLIQSKIGRLALLPAVPKALPHGTLLGSRARGDIEVDRLSWDVPAGTLSAVLTSGYNQTSALVLPPGVTVDSFTIDGVDTAPTVQGVQKQGCQLTLTAGKPVTIEATFNQPGGVKPVKAVEEKRRLTRDLMVGASHEVQLKSGQVVQVMKHSGETAVIMVQLADGSNGVYEVETAALGDRMP